MSNAVFPTLPGLGWSVSKTPEFRTLVHKSVSGMECRLALMSAPLWHFNLTFNFLRGGSPRLELETLMGFFLAREGAFDTFLYTDPSDCTVTDQQFGLGDGTTTAFQLVRALGGFVEPIQHVNAITNIKINGTPTSAYTLGATGIVTFTTPPAGGATLTWSGSFYFRCRFAQDSAEYEQFLHNLWTLKKVELDSVKG